MQQVFEHMRLQNDTLVATTAQICTLQEQMQSFMSQERPVPDGPLAPPVAPQITVQVPKAVLQNTSSDRQRLTARSDPSVALSCPMGKHYLRQCGSTLTTDVAKIYSVIAYVRGDAYRWIEPDLDRREDPLFQSFKRYCDKLTINRGEVDIVDVNTKEL